jgi:integrase
MKDVDLERGQLTVRGGKGDKDRYVMLPNGARERLSAQMEWRRVLHGKDLGRGQGRHETARHETVRAGAGHPAGSKTSLRALGGFAVSNGRSRRR